MHQIKEPLFWEQHEMSSLDDEIVECLASDLEHLFSIDYILHNFAIVSKVLAETILGVVWLAILQSSLPSW